MLGSSIASSTCCAEIPRAGQPQRSRAREGATTVATKVNRGRRGDDRGDDRDGG